MCGRYTLTNSAKVIYNIFGVQPPEQLLWPRYNIAPTQPVLAIRASAEKGGREAVGLYWGLVPPWADDVSIGNRLINARSETAASKNAFKHAYKRRRCLLPGSGFYEWRRVGKNKQPYYVQMADEQPFGLAGLWEHWQDEAGSELESCTILTTSPNALMAKLHDRMPVIIDPMDYEKWLDPRLQEPAAVDEMVGPYPPELMTCHPVSTVVNSPKNVTPDCVKAVPPIDEQPGGGNASKKQAGEADQGTLF